jgi:RNA polymerase sigma-70 factor (ECF subfamily)
MFDTRTNTTLLQALQGNSDVIAWRAFAERYQPVIERFARRLGVLAHDAADVAQSSMLEFLRSYRAGAYQRDRGRLRGWLLGIARHEIARLRRARRMVTCDHDALECTDDSAAAHWNREWDREVLDAALRRVRSEVDHSTFEAFERFGVLGQSAEVVAAELGMTPNAIYGAKRRVLERLQAWLRELETTW